VVREVADARKRNPLSDLNNILRGGRYRRRNHLCKSWGRSVQGFRSGGGQSLPFSIDFDRHPYNAQRDGRPVNYRRRPLFNVASSPDAHY